MVLAIERLVLLGCGYVGHALAREARLRDWSVLATTRSTDRQRELSAAGLEALLLGDGEELAGRVDERTALLVTFPPDGRSDARLAPLAARAGAAAYISSTGVFGLTPGVIDDTTPAAPDSPRTALRLEAEQAWSSAGATILRVPAIYGPGRGMHERVREGSARIAGDGTHHICRIHVDDLSAALLAAVDLRLGPETYVVGDDEPAQQGEVVRWLALQLGLPEPARVPLESVSETLRHDRRIDASRFKQVTGMRWRYPSYREGFAACWAAEAQLSPFDGSEPARPA